MIVSEVALVHRHFNVQDVRLSVDRNGRLYLGRAQNCTSHDCSKLSVSEAHLAFAGGGAIRASEILALDDRLLVLGLDWSKSWRDCFNNWSIVVQITVALLCGDNRLPLLHVEGDPHDSLGVCRRFGRPEDKGIIVNLSDLLNLADLGTIHIFELGVERDIVTNRSIVKLELLEADTTHLNASLA